jgi:hypothetical protein
MKKVLIALMIATTLVAGVGCTKQSAAKNFGGTYTLELEKGKKLVNMTWKDDDLWYLTKDMTKDDVAETYQFIEDSTYGLMQGKVIIKETK